MVNSERARTALGEPPHASQGSLGRDSRTPSIGRCVRDTLAGRLPERYAEHWPAPFQALAREALAPGVRVLDVGSGRAPSISPVERPAGCHYAGLDLSAAELRRAPAGSYDEMIVTDVNRRRPELEGRFDLVVSWQVLEHVRPLDMTLENLRRYLRPGGRLVAQMSGCFSAFGLINQVVPPRLGVWAMARLLGRDPESVFPAYYHRCWYGALARTLAPWSEWQILPRYRGAPYLGFMRPLQAAYMAYEEWAVRGGHDNLATHYLVVARR
jgi:SAM-dependent methyltransferase